MMGKSIRTTNKNWQCVNDIDKTWQYLQDNNIFAQIPHSTKPYTILSLYTDYDPGFRVAEDNYSVIIGAQITDVTSLVPDLVVKRIPAQTYAVFTAQGPFDQAIPAAWNAVWNSDLNRAFTSDFEWYDTHSTNDEKSIVKIYIALK